MMRTFGSGGERLRSAADSYLGRDSDGGLTIAIPVVLIIAMRNACREF